MMYTGTITGQPRQAFMNMPGQEVKMITESFIFLPGVQDKTERKLWESGITTWDHLLEAKSIPGISGERLVFWKGRIRVAQQLLAAQGPASIARLFDTRNAWRAYPHLLDNPRFVDIETTEYRHEITVIGVSDGEFYQAFVKGRNLDMQSLRKAFEGATCIVTFNGASFDLPIIARNFPGLLPNVPHLDLRHICAQAGLHGGLKRIEEHLGVARAMALREIDGSDAILLWYRHALGDEDALRELVDYNAADVLNLQPIAQLVIPALWKNMRHGAPFPFQPLSRVINWSDPSY